MRDRPDLSRGRDANYLLMLSSIKVAVCGSRRDLFPSFNRCSLGLRDWLSPVMRRLDSSEKLKLHRAGLKVVSGRKRETVAKRS